MLFTSIQAYEYNHILSHHLFFSEESANGGLYGSTFFMATGFHGFHVLIGTIFLTVCLIRLLAGGFSPKQHFGFEAAAWYWHFVDVVWLFLFSFIYVIFGPGGREPRGASQPVRGRAGLPLPQLRRGPPVRRLPEGLAALRGLWLRPRPADSGDGPVVFILLIVGSLVCLGALLFEFHGAPADLGAPDPVAAAGDRAALCPPPPVQGCDDRAQFHHKASEHREPTFATSPGASAARGMA